MIKQKKNTPASRTLSVSGALAAALITIIMGTSVVAVKITYDGLGPFTTAGLRFSIAAVTIALWALTTQRPFKLKPGQKRHVFILGFMFIVQLSLFHLGLSWTHASRGALLINTQPFFVLLFAHFFISTDRITKKKAVGICMGFTGVVFVFLGNGGLLSEIQAGDFMIAGTAVVWGAASVYSKIIIDDFQPFHLVLYPMLIATPFFFMEGFFLDDTMIKMVNLRIVCAMLYQSVITAAFSYVAWAYLIRLYGATALHSFIFLMPVAGVLFAGLLLNEPVTKFILVALALISAGIVVIHYRPQRGRAVHIKKNNFK